MSNTYVEIDGKQLALSNLDKVLYPLTGTTKAAVIEYYSDIAPIMLRHLHKRALTLVRAPNGVDGQRFFEKRCPPHHPDWVQVGGPQGNCVADSRATLVWLANLAAIELHTLQSRVDHPERAIGVVFDLDPGEPSTIATCCTVAVLIRDLLAELGLQAFVKTSGKKGIHLFVPLFTDVTPDAAKSFALTVGKIMAERFPDGITTDMKKVVRKGKVFIDWSQNDESKTTISAYSMRLNDDPTVSTPITWDEVEETARAGDEEALFFDINSVRKRVNEFGDIWADAVDMEQTLPTL